MKKILFYLYILVIFFACSCSKTINVKTQLNDVQYIQPPECIMEVYKPQKYQTKIINNYIAFDKKNLLLFLQNFQNYQFLITKYINCFKNNEVYYKKILKRQKDNK